MGKPGFWIPMPCAHLEDTCIGFVAVTAAFAMGHCGVPMELLIFGGCYLTWHRYWLNSGDKNGKKGNKKWWVEPKNKEWKDWKPKQEWNNKEWNSNGYKNGYQNGYQNNGSNSSSTPRQYPNNWQQNGNNWQQNGKTWQNGQKWEATPKASSDASNGNWREASAKQQAVAKKKPAPKTQLAPPERKVIAPLKAISGMDRVLMARKGLVNKICPEKFDPLYEKLVKTMEQEEWSESETSALQVCENVVTMVYDAASRLHKYIGVYGQLVEKLAARSAEAADGVDWGDVVWQHYERVLVSLEQPLEQQIPNLQDLPKDEQEDRLAKHKQKTVGALKFGGELVARQLVRLNALLEWLVDTTDREIARATRTKEREEDEDRSPSPDGEGGESLEAVCAVLTALGDRIDDLTTPSEARVVADLFKKLENLALTTRVSKRMCCLLNDLLDMRAGTERLEADMPQTLVKREKKKDQVPSWCEPALWWQFKAVDHTLEVTDSREEKVARLRHLVQMAVMKNKTSQMVIVLASASLKRARGGLDDVAESLGFTIGVLEYSMTDEDRLATIDAFTKGHTRILFITADVATRRGYDFKTPDTLQMLVNFDYAASTQLYLFRIYKRTVRHEDPDSRARAEIQRTMSGQEEERVKVLTFFESGYDLKHASALRLLLETAEAPVPARLIELAEVDPRTQLSYEQSFGEDPREKQKDWARGKSGGERERAHSHTHSHYERAGDRRGDRAASDWGPGPRKKEKRGGAERSDEWKRSQSGDKEWKGKKEKVPRLPDDWKRAQSSPADGSGRRRWDGWSNEVRAEALALGGWKTEDPPGSTTSTTASTGSPPQERQGLGDLTAEQKRYLDRFNVDRAGDELTAEQRRFLEQRVHAVGESETDSDSDH